MLSGELDVTFRVQVETSVGETVCVVGDCRQLGEWKPEKAKKLQREHGSSKIELWSTTMRLPVGQDVQYRYFVAYLHESDHEGEEMDVMITKWESNIRPRQLSMTAMSGNGNHVPFGEYNGKKAVDRGWLTGQTEIQLRLYNNPLRMWKRKHREQLYRIKCTTIDLRYRDAGNSWEDDESQDFIEPTLLSNQVKVAVLDGKRDNPKEQEQFGTIYNENDYFLFTAQTFDPEVMGYQFDFFVQPGGAESKDTPKHVGVAFLLPVNLTDNIGMKTMHITGLNHRPIGEMKVDYLIIRPLQNFKCDMKKTFARHWKRQRRPLDFAHRGMGSSYHTSKCAVVRENTVASLADAGNHGADYVEFDVQLSKDRVPVIYHDFKVCLSLKKKSEDLEFFEIPINELSFSKLQMLKLDHVSSAVSPRESCENTDPEERQPFPTLKKCLETIDEHVGFNIEIKYAMQLKAGGYEDGLKHYMERNAYVDIILEEILRYAGNRRIIISCFDPDVCSMVRLKQNRYPVQFLFQGKTEKYPPFSDRRSYYFREAISYANAVSILGINPHAEDVLQDNSLITLGKEKNLILLCWGEDANDKETISKLKQLGVDGVIFDRIQELKGSKENVFKMEHKSKMELLKKMGALTSDGNTLLPVSNVSSLSSAASESSMENMHLAITNMKAAQIYWVSSA